MTIGSVEAIPIRVPRARGAAVRTAGSPTVLDDTAGDYRWSALFPVLYAVNFETALVKVTLEDGRVGWGEAQAPLAPEVACTIVRVLLAPVLAGQDFEPSPEGIQTLWDRMYATMRVRGQTGGFMLDAISGVDIALWDLAGQLHRKPVCAMIPGSMQRTEVKAYLSGIPGDTIGTRVQLARARQQEGFATFKLFYDCASESEFLDTLGELRRELGAGAGLAADALWRLDLNSAIRLGQSLDRIGALWLEAPLAPEDPLPHGALARAIRTPIAIGESYRTRFELGPFFRENAIGIVQPDVGRCGITESIHIAQQAAERGIAVIPHVSIAMGPQIAAAIHLAAALPNCEMLEFNPNVLEIANRYVSEPLQVLQGRYQVPQTPGLGCGICTVPAPVKSSSGT